MSRVSCVIKTHNNLEFLRRCINSIMKHSVNPEICICNDGSRDGTDKYLKEISKKHKFIKYVTIKKSGLCTAQNAAAELSTRDYLFILDDDNILSSGWESTIEKYLKEDTIVSVVQVEPGNRPVSPFLVEKDFGKGITSFSEMDFIKFAEEIKIDNIKENEVSYPVVINKNSYFRVKGVDETFNKAYANDPDLWYKLKLSGHKFIRVGDVVTYHFQGKSNQKQYEKEREDREIECNRDFVRKWGEMFRYSFGSDVLPGVAFPTLQIKNPKKVNYEPKKDLTAIVLLSYKRDDLLNLCMEFVNKNSKNFQLIIENNDKPFTQSVNDGLERAMKIKPEYVVILNNDVIVTPNWLERLKNHYKKDKSIGMLSPMSAKLSEEHTSYNYQHIKVPYDTQNIKIEELDEFANKHYQENKGKRYAIQYNKGPEGFCMMLKGEHILQCGLFDKDLIMYCSDIEYALRLIKSGYTNFIAKDTYVHHIAHQTVNSKDMKERCTQHRIKDEQTLHNKIGAILNDKTIYLSLVMCIKNEQKYFPQLLRQVEPYFDEIIVVDDSSKDETLTRIKEYFKEEKGKSMLLHDNKLRIYNHALNNNFSAQHNFGADKAKGSWLFFLDADEVIDSGLLGNLRSSLFNIKQNNSEINTIGMPRVNLIDGKRTQVYPDYQYRLHKKDIKWVNPVHEIPETVKYGQENPNKKTTVALLEGMHLIHPKSKDRQVRQNEFYKTILKKRDKKIKNVLFNSVLYTTEGITIHGREEIKQLLKNGYKVFATDYRYNPKYGKEFMRAYSPIDMNEDYITIVNQPPLRANNPQFSLVGSNDCKNLIYYLACETNPPEKWVNAINESSATLILTPSEYSKQCMIKAGVEKPISILQHGIDPSVYSKTQDKTKSGKFNIIWCGTTHNKRKGLDLAVRAFSEEFKGNNKVQLIVKANKIYNQDTSTETTIQRNLFPGGNDNILIIEDELTDEEIAKLLNDSHIFLNTSRAEGFGIFPLQAMACGTPVITTLTGEAEYANKDNSLIIESGIEPTEFVFPYYDGEWLKPDIESIKSNLRKMYSNYNEYEKQAVENAKVITEKWNWDRIGKDLINVLEGI